MTIATVRMYFWTSPQRQRLQQYLGFTQGGFEEWFKRRLKPIREQLRGPEVKGVGIVNFMFCDGSPSMMGGRHGEWTKALSTLQFTWNCDLEALRDQPPLENVERLMRFAGSWCAQAPWPQVHAVGEALAAPLSEADRASLLPFLTWPREDWFRKRLYSGEQLELAMANARRDVAPALREARYLKPKRGPAPSQ